MRVQTARHVADVVWDVRKPAGRAASAYPRTPVLQAVRPLSDRQVAQADGKRAVPLRPLNGTAGFWA